MVALQPGDQQQISILRIDKARPNADNCLVAKTSTTSKISKTPTARATRAKSQSLSAPSNFDAAEDKVRRLQQQNQAFQRQLDKARKSRSISFKYNRFGPLMFALTFGVIGMYFALSGFATPEPSQERVVNLSIEPSTRQLSQGETFSVSVWADSLDYPMGAIQASLTYPAAAFDFVSLDTDASPFTHNTAPSDTPVADAGSVLLSRSAPLEGVIGRQFVGTISFKAKADASNGGANVMSFSKNSKVLRAGSQTDILQRTFGGTYHISTVAVTKQTGKRE